MIVWPAKDPGEVLDYSWDVPLNAGDSLSSYTATPANVTKDSDTSSDGNVVVWLSGGTDGVNATVALTAVTANGRTFKETAILSIFDRASQLLAAFRLRFPDFAQVADGTIGYWLNDVGEQTGFPTDVADTARLSLAAHYLALHGHGTGIDTQRSAKFGGATQVKSGSLSLTWDKTGSTGTRYGDEYLSLVRAYKGGPHIAGTGTWPAIPAYGWPYGTA